MKFLHRIFFSIIALALCSCSISNSLSNGRAVKIRIVDLQGNAHNVKMRTPELNIQALTNQGKISEENINSQPAEANNSAPPASSGNKYASNSAEALTNTLQLPEDPQKAAQASAARPSVTESDIIIAGNTGQNQAQEIEYNLSNKTTASKAEVVSSKATKKLAQKEIFVQTGSFAILQYAKLSLEQIEKDLGKSNIKIAEATNNGKTVYRVLIGPFPNKQKAAATIAKLAKLNHQAIIVRNK